MAIIVVGKLALKPGTRAEFVLRSIVSVALARKDVTCLDFAVSPDPIDSDRVNVYEKWKSRADVAAALGSICCLKFMPAYERFIHTIKSFAYSWVTTKNKAFKGRAPLDFMLNEPNGLAQALDYLRCAMQR